MSPSSNSTEQATDQCVRRGPFPRSYFARVGRPRTHHTVSEAARRLDTYPNAINRKVRSTPLRPSDAPNPPLNHSLTQHASHGFESLQNVETSLVHLELQCRFVMRAVAHLEDVERAPHLGLELEVSE